MPPPFSCSPITFAALSLRLKQYKYSLVVWRRKKRLRLFYGKRVP